MHKIIPAKPASQSTWDFDNAPTVSVAEAAAMLDKCFSASMSSAAFAAMLQRLCAAAS